MKKALIFIALGFLPAVCFATWNEFYMVTTGSDTNSGSTSDNTAVYSSSSGTWKVGVSNNDRFTAVSGTPFTGATTGMYASIYYTTTTAGAIFVASVTAVDAGGTWVEVDTTTIKYGVQPSTNSAGLFACKIGGAWAGRGVILSLWNARTVPQSTRINIKAGTYANTSNVVTFGSSGGGGNLLWWRGYKTTPGDQDSNNLAVNGNDIPVFGFTTAGMSVTGANQIFSNMVSSCAYNNAVGCVDAHAVNLTFYRFRAFNSLQTANGMALVQNSAATNLLMESCYFQASTTSTNAIQMTSAAGGYLIGSTVVGASVTVALGNTGNMMYRNKIYGSFGSGVSVSASGPSIVLDNTIYAPGYDGIRIAAAPTNGALILNNHFENVNGVGAAAVDLVVSSNMVHLSGNSYYNCTTTFGATVLEGFAPYDNPALSVSCLQSPTTQNFAVGPACQNIAYPTTSENLPNDPNSYMDTGASQAARESSYAFGP